MILVADSGSTKTDWMLVNSSGEKFTTAGFNPNFRDEKFIYEELTSNRDLTALASSIEKVYFFGAGCSSPERNAVVRNALKKFFGAADIEVDHDIRASVLATCGDQPGIACILGTGSNSCYFDGTTIEKNNYGLGYILGDEGGGTYFGKKVITHYLYKLMPDATRALFESQYKLTKDEAIDHVYAKPSANVWMASFAKFLTDHPSDEWVRSVVKKGFSEFWDLYVCRYTNYQNLNTHFVGSIAYYFSDILKEVAAEKNGHLGKIIRHPIESLAEYYKSK